MYILIHMTTKIRKWGNSYAVRIPKATALKHGFRENSQVHIIDEGNGIKIKPVLKKYNLNELLDQIKPENIHPLIDWGPDVGNEVLPEWKD